MPDRIAANASTKSVAGVETQFVNQSADELSADELKEYREIFNLMDRDGGGSISNEELGELMDTLGITATQDEIDLMINEIDQDSNGEIDFEEFVGVMSRKVNATYTQEQVRNAFRMFEEPDNPGLIRPDKLEEVLMQYCLDNASRDQIQELVFNLEKDSHGMFHYDDYVKMMMS